MKIDSRVYKDRHIATISFLATHHSSKHLAPKIIIWIGTECLANIQSVPIGRSGRGKVHFMDGSAPDCESVLSTTNRVTLADPYTLITKWSHPKSKRRPLILFIHARSGRFLVQNPNFVQVANQFHTLKKSKMIKTHKRLNTSSASLLMRCSTRVIKSVSIIYSLKVLLAIITDAMHKMTSYCNA